jgi:hypothetical protein
VEHAAHQHGGIDARALGHAGGLLGGGGTGLFGLQQRRILHEVAHEEAALRPRLHQALGLQQIVCGHHRMRAHCLLACAFAHRGQACARRQQPHADAFAQALGQLGAQGLRRSPRKKNGHGKATRNSLYRDGHRYRTCN